MLWANVGTPGPGLRSMIHATLIALALSLSWAGVQPGEAHPAACSLLLSHGGLPAGTLLSSPGVPQDEEPPELTPEELEAIFALSEELRETLKSGTVDEQQAVLARAAEVEHFEVVRAIEDYLRAPSRSVRKTALEILRWMKHPSALEALHEAYRRELFVKDADLYALLLYGIGQHADPISLPYLTEKPLAVRSDEAIRARILAIGRYREKKAVTELVALMQKLGRSRVDRYMRQFRLSFMVLCGTDQGLSPAAWARWWEQNSKGFRPTKALLLKPSEQRTWERIWSRAEGGESLESGAGSGDG